MTELSDGQLAAVYLAGDEAAFAELVKRHLPAVFNFTARLIGRTRDAEDITQEAFVKIWRHLKRYDQTRNFRVWAFRIAKNTALDFLKKGKEAAFSDFDDADGGNVFLDQLADPQPLPPDIFDRSDLATRVATAVDGLPPKQRLVLHLHYKEELTFAEIGDILDEPLHTVKSRHQRGVQALRARLVDAPNPEQPS